MSFLYSEREQFQQIIHTSRKNVYMNLDHSTVIDTVSDNFIQKDAKPTLLNWKGF